MSSKTWALGLYLACFCILGLGCEAKDGGSDDGGTTSAEGGSGNGGSGGGGKGGESGEGGGGSSGEGGSGPDDGGTRDATTDDAGSDAAADSGADGGEPDAEASDLLALGAACEADEECASDKCVDDVCCTSECGTCGECVAPSGTCVAILSGEDPDSCAAPSSCSLGDCVPPGELGALCEEDHECDSGECVDGVCCSTGSCGGCESCALGGGTCSAVLNAEDPNGACSGVNVCDGSGDCKLKSGQSCAGAEACASGACTDDVCCVETCGECEACTGEGGTCEAINFGEDPDSCVSPSYCTVGGACFTPSPLGAECDDENDCESGACVDGVCCMVDSCDTCESCALGEGSCATVTSADDDSCSGPNTCDAAGACRLQAGEACESAGECGSDSCRDGHCCGESCSGACQGCDGDGQCVAVTHRDGPQCEGDNSCSSAAECLAIDQEQLTPRLVSVAALNDTQSLAQTFTVGVDGELAEIRLAINCNPEAEVRARIESLTMDGAPSGTVLAETVVVPGPQDSSWTMSGIAIPALEVQAGDQLAITLETLTSFGCGIGPGPNGTNSYIGGRSYYRGTNQDPWISGGEDLMFQTLMR